KHRPAFNVMRGKASVLASAAVGLAVASALAGTSALTPRPMLPSSMGFFDSQHAVIGTAYTFCLPIVMVSIPPCHSGAILVTGDGGRTTRVVLRTKGPVTSVAAAPGGQAWAFVFHCPAQPNNCPHGTLLHSSDTGRTWRAISHLPLLNFSFADKLHGLGVETPLGCDPACNPLTSLVSSADGGKTW